MITFVTVTGRELDLSRPRASSISIEDIATALSKICRYNGQVELFYSDAQHACLVAELVRPELAFPALNHDNSEAYLGDVSSKLKHAPEMQWYRDQEVAWTRTIEQALRITSLTFEERHEIKVADDLAAVFERVTLRYHRDFQLDDIARACEQGWVTESTPTEMLAIAHRLPKFMVAQQDHRLAKAMFMTSFVRYGVNWREGFER